MINTAILGVGSPFSADNIAEFVIDYFRNNCDNYPVLKSCKMDYYDRPGLALVEKIQPYEAVYLIDAMVSTSPSVTYQRFETTDVLLSNAQNFSSHGFGVAEALMLAKNLQCLPRHLVIYGIEINLTRNLEFEKHISVAQNILDEIYLDISR